jgi:hypothetical protein
VRAKTESVLAALREEMVLHQRAQARLAFLACHDALTADFAS